MQDKWPLDLAVQHNFQGANLIRAILHDANLTDNDFRGATFRGAVLVGADFRDSDLTEVDFTGANLDGAIFSHAILDGAAFTNAFLERADFRGARGLSTNFRAYAKSQGALVDEAPTSIACRDGDMDD